MYWIYQLADVAGQLIQDGTLSLYKGPTGTEYWSLFNKLDYTDNPEVILWKTYDVRAGCLPSCKFVP